MAKEILPLEEKVSIKATTNQNYSDAFNQMGLTPDAYGQLGASVALSASVEYNKRRGLESGLNPSGDTLPPITAADKAYVDAYKSQSYATLSNQAQNVFYEADQAISKLNKVTPSDIEAYRQTIKGSMEDILSLAPKEEGLSLFNKAQSQLQSSVNEYQNRYIGQQKNEQKDNLNMALSDSDKAVHDAFMSGDKKGATEAIETQKRLIDESLNSGLITNKQADAARVTARINFETNSLIEEGIKATSQGKQADWQATLVDPKRKPEGMSWSEWESSTVNAQKYMAQRESFTKQSAQLIASNGSVEINEGRMTPKKLQQYQEDLKEHPLTFNNLNIQYINWLQTQEKSVSQSAYVMANWDNPTVLASATGESVNTAFRKKTQNIITEAQASGKPISLEDAEYQAASTAAIPISAYNDALAKKMMSGNPALMRQAGDYYRKLDSLPGNKTLSFMNNQDAMAMMNNFESALTSGKSDIEAAQQAMDIQHERKTDKEYATRINNLTTQYLNDNFNTSKSGFNKVMKELNVGGFGQSSGINPLIVPDQGALVSQWRKMFAMNMQLTRGDTQAATKMTKDGINKTWGETDINGRREFMQFPVDKYVPGGSAAKPLIQLNMHNDIKRHVDFNKQVYDLGQQDFYYELKPFIEDKDDKRYSDDNILNEYTKAKENKSKIPWYSFEGNFKDDELVRRVEQGRPQKVTKIWRNGQREEWEVYLKSNPYQNVSTETGQLLGKYDLGLYNPNAKDGERTIDSFYGIFADGERTPSYYPDSNFIAQNFTKVAQEPIISHEEQLKKQEAYLNGGGGSTSPVIEGNIDMNTRPQVLNPDGKISTVATIGIERDGLEYVIPQVSDEGKMMSEDEAIKNFEKTGKHLGAFKTRKEATKFAQDLHKSEEEKLKKQESYLNEGKQEPIQGADGQEVTKGSSALDKMGRVTNLNSANTKVKSKAEETKADPNSELKKSIAKVESGKKGMNAVSKTGAIGKYQFIKKTWDSLVDKHGKKLGITKDMITDEKSQEKMMDLLIDENKKSLRSKLARPPTNPEIYMAHNIGPAGAAKLIKAAKADPKQQVTSKIINSKLSNNPKFFMKGGRAVTVGEAIKRYNKEIK